jgi:tetratricopeptide (TPR) repeat protein
MNSLKRPLSLLMLALLAACAAPQAPVLPSSAMPSSSASGVESTAKLPKVELTPELLFGVLASEIAAQRGAVGSAAMTDLVLARQTRDPRLAERAAQFAILSGNLAAADDALKLWLETDPDSLRAREQLIAVSLAGGDFATAQSLTDDLLTRKPELAAAVFGEMARIAPQVADKAAMAQLVDKEAARYPNLPEARFAVVTASAGIGDQASIDASFDALAKLAPKWDLPVAWEAERLRRMNAEAASDFLHKELARRPDASLDLKMAYPRLLVADRRFVEARQAFEALRVQYPRNPDILYASGLLAFQLDDLPTARTELEAALAEHYPDGDFLRFSLGQIAEAQDDNVAAAGWYRQVGKGAQYLPAQVRLAYLQAHGGDLDGALARLDAIGGSSEERMQLVLVGAEFAREAKRLDTADALLTRALKRHPRTPEYLYERALISDARHDTPAAERDLRQILKLRPHDEQALNALGYILVTRTTRYQEAYGLIDKALKIAPDNAMIIDSMGWVLFKLGHTEDALKYLQQAYAALPDQEIAAHYGEVLWTLGRKDEAKSLWTRAAQQAGDDHPAIDETMRRLTGQ